ncbi:MAG: phage major capsid protein [Coriobacteriia bacterium]|nr:phage major capsid protein [Coriobacteriia bacterium]
MPGLNLNTRSNYVPFPHKLSDEVWKKTTDESVVMRLGREMALDAKGTEIAVINQKAAYHWNWGNETDERVTSETDVQTKTIMPYEIYVTQPFSNKLRDNDEMLYKSISEDLPAILGAGIDETVFTADQDDVGENFDTFSNVQEVSIQNDVWHGFVTAKKKIQVTKNRFNGIALSPEGEAHFEDAVDNIGRPLFVSDVINDIEIGKIRGRQALLSNGLYIPEGEAGSGIKEQLAIMGDWNKLRWGFINGIKARVYDQAVLKLPNGQDLNLARRHMFALEYCVEVGVGIEFADAFARLTGGEPAPSTSTSAPSSNKNAKKAVK